MTDTTANTDPPLPPSEVALTFDAAPAEAVPVVLDEKTIARQRRKAKLAEARAYEQLGQRLLKFKAKKFGEVGEFIVKTLGVKQVGHGTIISASENADQYIQRCDALVKELLSRDPPCDPEVIVSVMQLAKEFNAQLLDAGRAHVLVDRQPATVTETNNYSMPFPAGTPMTIEVNKPTQRPPPAIEDAVPEA